MGRRVEPVTPERWPDLHDLFSRRGPRGGTPMTDGCHCMWWRQRTGSRDQNVSNMRAVVGSGRVPGLLAYADDGTAIGWVSVAPRTDFGQLMRSRHYGPRDADDGVWSIVCFYVDPRHKRQGVAHELLDAAIVHARRHGARAVEAYVSEAGDYMGRLEDFTARGFAVARAAGKRTVVRLSLRS